MQTAVPIMSTIFNAATIFLIVTVLVAPSDAVYKMRGGKKTTIDCKKFACNIRDFDKDGNPGEWQRAQSFSGGNCHIEIRTFPSNHDENLCIVRWVDVGAHSVGGSISATGPSVSASTSISTGERAFEGNCQAWCGSESTVPARGAAQGTISGDELATYHSCYGWSENDADPHSDDPFCYVSSRRYDDCGSTTAQCGTTAKRSGDDWCPHWWDKKLWC